MDPALIEWLLAGDPAVRWQVQRDLLDASPQTYGLTQELVASAGWGARLLGYQDPEGTWGGGLYGPKWISTTYTLLTLRRLGLPAENEPVQRGCKLLLDHGFRSDNGIHYIRNPKIQYSETCITGMVLSMLAYFRYPDERVHAVAQHLVGQQMADGGWNCESYNGATHGSVHTTISVLEGLWEYEKAHGEQAEINATRARGHEFLWRHHLYRSHRTGEIFDKKLLTMPFPPRWRFDFLRALDYFQDCNAARAERLTEAIELLKARRKKDGRWTINSGMSGLKYFELEKAGQPSRINTLRALRVLRWWQN